MAGLQNCKQCGRPRPVELEMKLKTGETLRMTSCTRCETRTWAADGRPVELDEVLQLTSGNADYLRTPVVRERSRR